MIKLQFAIAFMISLVFSSTSFGALSNLEVRGCTFEVNNLYKGENQLKHTWGNVFDIKSRMGVGIPMVEVPKQVFDTYVGKVDFAGKSSGYNLEVRVTKTILDLIVEARVSQKANEKTKTIVSGESRVSVEWAEKAMVTSSLTLKNPFIDNLIAEEKVSSPFNSPTFPLNTVVFERVTISCFGEQK